MSTLTMYSRRWTGIQDSSNFRKRRNRLWKSSKAIEVLEGLDEFAKFGPAMIEKIFKYIASIVPRLYLVASCPVYPHTEAIQGKDNGNFLDIIVKVNPGGRFSDVFMSQAKLGTHLRFGLTKPDSWKIIKAQKPNTPLIAICTGSGSGPIRKSPSFSMSTTNMP